MKKIFSTAALTLFIGLTISGCTSSTTPDPIPDPAPAPAVSNETPPPASKPVMDETQRTSLVEEFKKIDPSLGDQRSVVAAQPICRTIQNGEAESVQLDFAKKIVVRNTSIQSGPATDEAAKKIIDVIKSNGFCKESP